MAIRYPLSSGPLSNQPVRSYLFNTYKRTESRKQMRHHLYDEHCDVADRDTDPDPGLQIT